MTRATRPAVLALLTAATTWVAMLSWRSFTAGTWHALVVLAVVGGAIALSGWALRLVRVPAVWVVLAQGVLGWAITSAAVSHSVLPIHGAARERLVDALNNAFTTVQVSLVPVQVTHGIEPYLLFGGALALWLADLLAMTLRRPALGGVAVLAVLGLTFGMNRDTRGVTWWEAALIAAGFVGQLALRQSESVDVWGRRLPGTAWISWRSLRWSGGLVGAASAALAVTAAAIVPVAHVDLAGFAPGDNGSISVTDPLVGLKQELNQGADIPLLEVRTQGPAPSYLRLTALDRYTGSEWIAGTRSIPSSQRADGKPLPQPGLDPSVRRSYATEHLQATPSFSSRWLPTPFPAASVQAKGDWRYDRSTVDFLAVPNSLTTRGLSYTARAEYLHLTKDELVADSSPALTAPAIDTDLPFGMPTMIGTLAARIVHRAGATTPFAEAVALQRWFRGGGGFTYDTHVDLSSDAADTVRFLTAGHDGRSGYCQQFASAFALMARTLGIPARVAVGFLTPARVAPGVYVFSTHDAHAWPELFFPGAGWIRFEPTPAARAATVPGYTTGPLPTGVPQPGNSGVTHPSHPATVRPSHSTGSNHPHPAPQTGHRRHRHGGSGTPWLIALGALVLATVLLATPSWLRRRRRRHRLTGTPEQAWAEVRDTVTDLQLPWPAGRSPREAGQRLRPFLDADGRDALRRMVAAVEQERYAPAGGTATIERDARQVVDSLTGNASARMSRRARWWPSSLWQR